MIDTDELLDAARAGLATGAVEEDGDAAARVSLWRSGSRLALAEASGPEPLAAVRTAAARLMETDASDASVLVEAVAEQGPIEVEGLSGLIGSTAGSPDGLLLRDGESVARGWPFDALRTDGRHAAWAKQLNRQARPPGARLASSTSVERFGTIEAMGPVALPDEDELVAPRLAGFRVVDPNEVLPDRMIGAAFQSAAWLLRHQRQDGLFAYEFLPATQSWSNADSIVRQAGCAWAVALVGRLGREPNISRAAAGAVEALLSTTLKRDGPGRVYYLAAPGEPPRLGAIPLLLLAIAELAQAATVSREVVDQLAATLLGVREPSGRLGVTVRGLELEGSETYYAGQVVLALARLHGVRKRDRYGRAIRRALAHYHERWADADERDLSFTTWMLQACDSWHHLEGGDDVAEYGFAMADWALESQHGPEHRHPLWRGAFQDTPGIGTAAYAEGIAAALGLARRVGDEQREARYEAALRSAMRFLLQLTVDASDAPLVGGDEHIGAVRSALHRSSLRCDNAQHFIMSALRTRALAFAQDS